MNSPTVVHEQVPVMENLRMARDTYRLRLAFPQLAALIRPGQFLMLRLPGRTDPLLGRAFALYDVVEQNGRLVGVDVVYLEIGKMTRQLAGLRPGDLVEAWGPLGNGFPAYDGVGRLVMVAGGIGQTPFLALGRRITGQRGYGGAAARVEVGSTCLYYGVRSADLLAGQADFAAAGIEVLPASDDGSIGFHGFVTARLDQELGAAAELPGWRLVGCGPEPMMQALWRLAERRRIPCDLSLETPMACGLGICFSCAVRVKTDDDFDYRRACVDGPVFDAAELVWE